MRMLVPPQKIHEEGAGRCQDYLVSLNLLTILTGKGDINKVVVFSQVLTRSYNIFPEVVPFEAKFFRHFVQHEGQKM